MRTIYLAGNPCHTYGTFPAAGDVAPVFNLVGADLGEVGSKQYEGKRIVLNIFPSLDTEVCARSVRRFNEEAAALDNTVVICVSMDLPFAMGRFCAANDIKDVVTASAFRNCEFAKEYGVEIVDGPLAGLLARSVIVIGTDGKVMYSQMVEEITTEPDYKAALSVLK